MEDIQKEVLLSVNLTKDFEGFLKKKKIAVKMDFKVVVMAHKS